MTGKRFTVAQANALLRTLRPVVEQLRDAQSVIAERHGGLRARSGGNGGGEEGAEFLAAVTAAGKAVSALTDAGIIVRDPGIGLIDFPSERDGEEILLCWRLGEDSVAWWHPTTSGFADRRPI